MLSDSYNYVKKFRLSFSHKFIQSYSWNRVNSTIIIKH